jgi:hypothetical protein
MAADCLLFKREMLDIVTLDICRRSLQNRENVIHKGSYIR